MTDPIALHKKALRAQMAERRAAAFAAPDLGQQVQAACAHIGRVLADSFGAAAQAVVLAAYMPMRSELDPLPAMQAHTGPVCVPVITGPGQALEFHRWHEGAEMMDGPFSARIPRAHDPLVPQALIVPLLAFDRRGYRLGYGGGFYDRTLQSLRAQGRILAMGFAFDVQEAPQVPTDGNDQRLDVIVTPSGLIWPQ
jgi:5-formyltetrahydrofolate cyclo-ligase